jgi:hypothetical protein
VSSFFHLQQPKRYAHLSYFRISAGLVTCFRAVMAENFNFNGTLLFLQWFEKL